MANFHTYSMSWLIITCLNNKNKLYTYTKTDTEQYDVVLFVLIMIF